MRGGYAMLRCGQGSAEVSFGQGCRGNQATGGAEVSCDKACRIELWTGVQK